MKRPIIKDLLFTIAMVASMLFVRIPYLGVILAASLVIIYALSSKDRFKAIGFDKTKSWIVAFVQSLILAAVILALSHFVIRPFVEHITGTRLNANVFRPLVGNTQLLALYISIGWIVGGISEELIFRGFLLKRIITYIPGEFGVVFAIILTSALFGFLHDYQGPAGQLQTGIIGAILASIYFASGKQMALTMFTHGMINTLAFSSIYFDLVGI